MNTVAIFGVGLMGGSFGLALKKAGFTGRIIGVSSPATIEAARAIGAIDGDLPADEAAQSADLIYLAQPIARILETLRELDRWVRPHALVTDAGSTKGAIVARASDSLKRCRFLGGHPLAGKESRGARYADADLFRGRLYVLTPGSDEAMREPAVRTFVDWLRRIGAQPLVTTAAQHDRVVAYTSHLPQLTSTALAACVNGEFEGAPPIWGPALVDSTRLALSAYEIWRDILETNRAHIDAALGSYINQLQRLREILGTPEMEQSFADGARIARLLRDSG
jgi:prephenate dehydrogenase